MNRKLTSSERDRPVGAKQSHSEQPNNRGHRNQQYGTVNVNNIRNTFNFNIIIDPNSLKSGAQEGKFRGGSARTEQEGYRFGQGERAKTAMVRADRGNSSETGPFK